MRHHILIAAACLTFCAALSPARAQGVDAPAAPVASVPLSFDLVPARDAAARISDQFAVNIVFKGGLDASLPVSFTVSDRSGTRLEAINDLANAVGADFQKTFVISKDDAAAPSPLPKIDTNGSVVFPSLTMPAAEAIRMAAAVDNATVQIYGDLSGTVSLPTLNMSASAAADEIARQTHTRWKAFYAILPTAQARPVAGRIIDRTGSGAPITEDPYVYYTRPTPVAQQAEDTTPRPLIPQQQDATANTNPYGPIGGPGVSGGFPPGYNPSENNGLNGVTGNGFNNGGMDNGGYNNGGFDNGSGLEILPGGYGAPIIINGGSGD